MVKRSTNNIHIKQILVSRGFILFIRNATHGNKEGKLNMKMCEVTCPVLLPVNESDRSGALARRNEGFDFDGFLVAELSKRRIRAFVTNPTEISIGNGRVIVGRTLPQLLDECLNLK